jgi:hypothetical protein
MRKLLRDAATPGDTGDIDLAVSELGNQTGSKLQTGWDRSQPRSRILNDYSYTPESSLEFPLSCRRGFR